MEPLDSNSTDSIADLPDADIDEKYWRQAILQRRYYRDDVGFDKYRWALRYGQLAHMRHGGHADFHDLITELAAGWGQFGGPSGLTWEEARGAIEDSWNQTDSLLAESIASRAGFKRPPTFSDHGNVVPRNIDEANL
jgi:hypothetical protein